MNRKDKELINDDDERKFYAAQEDVRKAAQSMAEVDPRRAALVLIEMQKNVIATMSHWQAPEEKR